jgi:transposase
MGGEPFAIYLDNLNIHKTIRSRALYDELEIFPIFSITYMPELNPIESCFSQVKLRFGQQRLWALINDIPFDFSQQIIDAFDVITPVLMNNCA